MAWPNLEEFTGEVLFPVARQQGIVGGGRPDIVALDESARVVVVEIKRDVDRGQLAQCLEYAGWARKTSLDELAGFYFGGPAAFWAAWQEFTESATPVVGNPHPRLVLVPREFQLRTQSAFECLVENGLPIDLIRVTVYENEDGRRFVDIGGDHEPEFPVADVPEAKVDHTKLDGRPIRLSDLIEAGLLWPGDELSWVRPKKGTAYTARVTENSAIGFEDGKAYASPSRAAMEAAQIPAYDGWLAWTVVRQGKRLNDLRHELCDASVVSVDGAG